MKLFSYLKGCVVGFVLLNLPLSAEELCVSSPCSANGSEFSTTAAQNGSKGKVEFDGDLVPNGTGNPTGLRMVWDAEGTGVGTPQGVVNYIYGYTGTSATIGEYAQNACGGTNQTFMGGNAVWRGGAYEATSGNNYGLLVQTANSTTLNASIVALANGSGTADNVAGTFLVTNGGGSGKATAIYAGSGSAKPNYLGTSVLDVDSLAINPLDVATFRVDDAVAVKIRRDGALQLADIGTKPTCNSAHRGSFWYDAGATGVADTMEVCLKDATDSYNWREVATP